MCIMQRLLMASALMIAFFWLPSVEGAPMTFAPAVDYAVGPNPTAVAAGDLDGDGAFDLAVTNSGSNTVSILRNTGRGMFVVGGQYAVGHGPASVALGDLDGQRGLDVVIANQGTAQSGADRIISVLRNQGNGLFSMAVNYDVGLSPIAVTVGDVDGRDGLDLAVANHGQPWTVSVLLNQGDGTFPALGPKGQVQYSLGSLSEAIFPRAVMVGDLDNDGSLDLAVGHSSSTVTVFWNTGDGTFCVPFPICTASPGGQRVRLATASTPVGIPAPS